MREKKLLKQIALLEKQIENLKKMNEIKLDFADISLINKNAELRYLIKLIHDNGGFTELIATMKPGEIEPTYILKLPKREEETIIEFKLQTEELL